MHIRYCPRCGHKVLPNAKFCGNCGYKFDTTVNTNNSNNVNQNNHRQFAQDTYQPRVQKSSYVPNNHIASRPHHHYGRWILGLIALVVIGAIIFFVFSGPSNNNTNTQSSNSSVSTQNKGISKSKAESDLSSVWQNVDEEANNGDDTSMYDYFTSKSDKSGYGQLNTWAKNMYKASSIKHIDFNLHYQSVTPVSNNESKVKYIVDYTFHNQGTQDRKQSFVWHATFKKVNGNWLISHNGSDTKPISNTTV